MSDIRGLGVGDDARQDIRDQAAVWSDRLRHRGGDARLRTEFEAWRQAHPLHAETFARIDPAHRVARAAKGTPGLAALERDTMARIARRHRRQWARRGLAMAASLLVMTTVGLLAAGGNGFTLQAVQQLPTQTRHLLAGERYFHTAIGEHRAITLTDGSTLTLNTGSRAVVRYRDAHRSVTLQTGQALFEVAKDPQRPFVVTAHNRTITALGTAFDVRLTGGDLAVTLLEGKVEVAEVAVAVAEGAADTAPHAAAGSPSHPSRLTPHVLSPGQQLSVTAAAAAPVVRPADPERITSWRTGQVIFAHALETPMPEAHPEGDRRQVLALKDIDLAGVVREVYESAICMGVQAMETLGVPPKEVEEVELIQH